MPWLGEVWDFLVAWWPATLAIFDVVVAVTTIAWVLMTKKDSTSAVAWCLFVLFVPFIGAISFCLFGNQHISRPLRRKQLHKLRYRAPPSPSGYVDSSANLHEGEREVDPIPRDSIHGQLARLAHRFGAYPVTLGNQICFYHEGCAAFDAMLSAIEQARHHIHLEFYIFQPDELGRQFVDLLAAKARQGVEVRLLYDAMGCYAMGSRLLRPLIEAGGKTSVFLPINLFRRRLQINMRNHRKILVVDGSVGFVGGLNVGCEYQGKSSGYGFWRDTHLRLEGPVVCDLQRIFCEDWDFAAGESLSDQAHNDSDKRYFRAEVARGPYPVQVIDSGPDREIKGIREVLFAGILKAKKRVWIASPYFVPDGGLLDAIRLAAYSGLDVRLLGLGKPDHLIAYLAGRYYWNQVLPAGVKIYQYKKGMMHAKVVLIDDVWASVGTANLDNRSMFLNFEVNCLLYSPDAVKELEAAFERDFADSTRLDRHKFAARSFWIRLAENGCRLLSPIL